MPNIPFISNSSPTPNIPNAVLDRNQRPTVNTQGIQQAIGGLAAAQKLPTIDGKAFAAPDEALTSVGHAIAQGGGLLGGLALKRKQAESDVQVAQEDAKMDGVLAEHVANRDPANPASWDADIEERIGAYKGQLAEREDLNPDARDAVNVKLTRFEGQAKARVMVEGSKASFSQARDSFLGAADNAIDNQDPEKFNDAITAARQRGYIFDHEEAALRKQYTHVGEVKKRQAEADAIEAVKNDVFNVVAGQGAEAAAKRLDEYKLAPADDATLRGQLHAVERPYLAGVASSVSDWMTNTELPTPAGLESFLDKQGHPVPTALKEQFLKELKTYNKDAQESWKQEPDANGIPNGITESTRLRNYIATTDPAKDVGLIRYYQTIASIDARADNGAKADLKSQLKEKYGLSQGGEAKEPWQKLVHTEMDRIMPTKVPKTEKYTSDGHTGGFWGMNDAHKAGDVKKDSKGNPVEIIDKHGNKQLEPLNDPSAEAMRVIEQAKVVQGMRDLIALNPSRANDPDWLAANVKGLMQNPVLLQQVREQAKRTRPTPDLPTQGGSSDNHIFGE